MPAFSIRFLYFNSLAARSFLAILPDALSKSILKRKNNTNTNATRAPAMAIKICCTGLALWKTKRVKRHSVKNIFTQAFEFTFQKGFHNVGLFFEIGKKRLIIKRKKIRNIGL